MVYNRITRVLDAADDLNRRIQRVKEEFEQQPVLDTCTRILKELENLYFSVCAFRNLAATAIDTLQLELKLRNRETPETADNTLLYGSTGVRHESGIISIYIPEALPLYGREISHPFRKQWQGYVYHALKQIVSNCGHLPCYNNAVIHFEVHSPSGPRDCYRWDTSNRAYNLVINVLNGILFPEDNARHISFLVTGIFNTERKTVIHVGDFERHLAQFMQNICEAHKNRDMISGKKG